MSKHRRARRANQEETEQETGQSLVQPALEDVWNTPEFRNKVLIDLAFVAAPAIIMLLLDQRIWAAGWFGVGVLVVIWQFWGQIRAFLRSFRSPAGPEDEDQS